MGIGPLSALVGRALGEIHGVAYMCAMKLLLPFALLLSGCATYATYAPVAAHATAEEWRVYDESRDADADLAAALSRVAGTDRKVIVALGANWCHDSRGFAEHLARDSIAPVIAEHYEVVFVDVARPQTGEGHNQHIVERFGLAPQVGTPIVAVLDSEGNILNAEDAQSWRNAHSRSEDEVRDYFVEMATR